MKAILILAAVCICAVAIAQSGDAERRRNFNTDNYVALRDFDPVSYFQNKPTKGSSKFSYHYKGITYYFANEANREEFKKAPDKYEPAYGGWCAYTIASTGQRVKVMPATYKIINGKLHLFYNFGGDNRLVKWNKDEKRLKAAAERNWQRGMH